VWLRIDQPSLSWSALAMISNHVSAQDLKAQRIIVLRRPVPSRKAGGETPRIDIGHLTLARIELAAPVIGHAVTLSASGGLHYTSLDQMEADLLISRDGNNDRYRIQGGIAGGAVHGIASILESADGILGRLAGLPGLGPVNLAARAGGDRNANTLSLNLTAGPLKAQGRGTVRLAAHEANPEMPAARSLRARPIPSPCPANIPTCLPARRSGSRPRPICVPQHGRSTLRSPIPWRSSRALPRRAAPSRPKPIWPFRP